MKKMILAALTMATTGFCLSVTEYATQTSLLTGCGASAGKTAIAFATPTYNGSSKMQFAVPNSALNFSDMREVATQSVVTGKPLYVEFGDSPINFSYMSWNNYTYTCYTQAFYSPASVTIKRQ